MKNLYFELKKKILQDTVKKSLELELNNIDEYGNTRFIRACRDGHYDIVRRLLNSKKDINYNILNNKNMTGYLYACKKGFSKIVELIINSPKNIIIIPIHKHRNSEGVLILITESEMFDNDEYDVICENYDYISGYDGFSIACSYGNIDVIQLLLESKNLENVFYNYTVSGFALESNIEWSDMTPFVLACFQNHIEVIKLLLKYPKLIDYNYWEEMEPNGCGTNSGFNIACRDNYIEIVQILLESQYDINYNTLTFSGCNGFSLACYNNNEDIVKLLLNTDKIIDYNQIIDDDVIIETAFIIACKEGHYNIIKLLIESDKYIDFNFQDNDGNTGFIYACKEKNTKMVELLLNTRKPININIKNNKNESCFDIAIQDINMEILELFLICFQNEIDICFDNLNQKIRKSDNLESNEKKKFKID